MINWDDLKWFAALADAGTFRLAATQTGLNHTTLSRRVSALEEALGTALLKRSPTGLELTEAGQDLRRSAIIISEEVADLQRRLGGRDASLEGQVSVTYSDGFASDVIYAVARLGELYPNIAIAHVNTEDFVDLGRRQTDIAIRASNSPPENLVGRRVGEIAWDLYGAKSRYPEAPAEFTPSDHDWVGFGGRWGQAAPTVWLRENVPAAQIRAEADDPQSIRELAAAGIGLGMLMRNDGDRDPRLTRICPWPGDLPPTSLWLLIHPDMRNVRRVRVVADYIYDHLRGLDGAFVS